MHISLLIHSAQLLTIPNGPQRGSALGDLGIIEDGAVAITDGNIIAVGKSSDLRQQYQASQTIDASGKVVMPGFVDPHTHSVWAGDRANEFEMRIAGATYMEIMNAGGGIMSTVRKTRSASVDQLIEQTKPRLQRMLQYGTTTVEIKTGYGLDTAAELRQWEAIRRLQADGQQDIVGTFLGAHATPEEFKGRDDAYLDCVINEMLPAIKEHPLQHTQYADIFCEDGAFTVAQSRRLLERAKELGFGLKIHADEFVGLGGTALAVELGAASSDHVVYTPDTDIAALGASVTAAVALPPTPFGLAQHDYTPAKKYLDAGAILAIATDCNPGTGWCESMQFVVALACRYMRLTPAQAIVAATINAAYAIGMNNLVGSLEPGKQADLLIMDVPDYKHIGYRFGTNLVNAVIKKGAIVATN
jgi:imidazolonepropionase